MLFAFPLMAVTMALPSVGDVPPVTATSTMLNDGDEAGVEGTQASGVRTEETLNMCNDQTHLDTIPVRERIISVSELDQSRRASSRSRSRSPKPRMIDK